MILFYVFFIQDISVDRQAVINKSQPVSDSK